MKVRKNLHHYGIYHGIPPSTVPSAPPAASSPTPRPADVHVEGTAPAGFITGTIQQEVRTATVYSDRVDYKPILTTSIAAGNWWQLMFLNSQNWAVWSLDYGYIYWWRWKPLVSPPEIIIYDWSAVFGHGNLITTFEPLHNHWWPLSTHRYWSYSTIWFVIYPDHCFASGQCREPSLTILHSLHNPFELVIINDYEPSSSIMNRH